MKARKQAGRARPPTKRQLARIDWLARLIAPEAWAEYDAGRGRCSNMAGWACLDSLRAAQRIVAAEDKAPALRGSPQVSRKH